MNRLARTTDKVASPRPKRRLLVVDDSSSMRQLVVLTLQSVGLEAVPVSNAAEALTVVANERFQLVLADVNMPGMDGISLTRRLRELPDYEHVPILILTTETSIERRNEGRAAGATGWLVKPFNPEQLIVAVSRAIQ